MRVEPVTVGPGSSTARAPEDKKLRQACRDFEAVFLHYVLKSMRQTVQKSELLGSSQEEEFFQDMMDAEVSKSLAEQRSSGIADLLYREVSRNSSPSQTKTRGTDL